MIVSGEGVGDFPSNPQSPIPNVSSGDSGLNRGYATTWGETAGTKVGTHGQYPAGLGKAVIRKYYGNKPSMMHWKVTGLHFARGAASIKVVCGQRCIKLWSGGRGGTARGRGGHRVGSLNFAVLDGVGVRGLSSEISAVLLICCNPEFRLLPIPIARSGSVRRGPFSGAFQSNRRRNVFPAELPWPNVILGSGSLRASDVRIAASLPLFVSAQLSWGRESCCSLASWMSVTLLVIARPGMPVFTRSHHAIRPRTHKYRVLQYYVTT